MERLFGTLNKPRRWCFFNTRYWRNEKKLEFGIWTRGFPWGGIFIQLSTYRCTPWIQISGDFGFKFYIRPLFFDFFIMYKEK